MAHRQPSNYHLWTTYMIRCPRCIRWKEARDFMLGNFRGHWQPSIAGPQLIYDEGFQNWDGTRLTESVIDGLRCHNCYVEEHGRDAFRERLSRFLKRTMDILRGNIVSVHVWMGKYPQLVEGLSKAV